MSEKGTTSEPVLLTEGSFLSAEEQLVQAQLIERTEDAILMQETLSEKLDKISIHEEEEESGYVTPIADPYGRAIRYMEKHNVMQIFQKLTAEIIYHRPDDPLSHMLDELQKMKKDRERNPPSATPE
ncbi:uncharacterized protein [Amphiura filiformis]|uniref:uncharacterized protein n=1 Tax=Amphiura filiformis TaxID=82378 RepID=UPI003B220EF8